MGNRTARTTLLTGVVLAGCGPIYNPYTAPLPVSTSNTCALAAGDGRLLIPAAKELNTIVAKPAFKNGIGLLQKSSIDSPTVPPSGPTPSTSSLSDTAYDAASGCSFATHPDDNAITAFDPVTLRVLGTYEIALANRPHRVVTDNPHRQLIVANDGNGTLEIIDLRTMQVTQVMTIESRIGGLQFDQQWRRLFLITDTGELVAYQVRRGNAKAIGILDVGRASTLTLDPMTHRISVGTESQDGRPVLRSFEAAPPKPPRCIFHHSNPESACWEGW